MTLGTFVIALSVWSFAGIVLMHAASWLDGMFHGMGVRRWMRDRPHLVDRFPQYLTEVVSPVLDAVPAPPPLRFLICTLSGFYALEIFSYWVRGKTRIGTMIEQKHGSCEEIFG